MSGVVGEFLVIVGSLQGFGWQAVVAALTVVLTAGYMLWMLRRVAFGQLNPERADMPDMTRTEAASILPLAAATVLVGVFPQLLAGVAQTAVDAVVRAIGG